MSDVRAIRLRARSALALTLVSVAGIVAFGWPFRAPSATQHASNAGGLAHSTDAPYLFVALLPLLLAIVVAELSEGGIDAKAIALLGVLAAIGAALRPLGGGATGFQPVFFLMVPAARVFGRGFGFVLGALTLFASALLTGGVGPWLPFQMLAAGWMGFGAGCLPRAKGQAEILLLAVYGAAAGFAFGLLMNLWFWPFANNLPHSISYLPGAPVHTNLLHWLRHDAATSLGWDVARGAGDFLFLLIAGRPVLLALRRAARRAAFDAPVEFAAAS